MLGENNTTYVVVKRPAAGPWTLTDDDTVPIRRIRQAAGLPRPSVSASVTGTGRRRTLHWRVKPIRGQRVRFVESGRGVRNVIATTRTRRGKARFRPADGPGGRRRIQALVEQNRLPRTSLVAGSYRAPARPRPARPRRVRISRRGARLVVSWRPQRRGFRHAVYVKLSDRRGLLRIVSARRRSVALRGVARYGATATVVGLTNANGRGPSARASIRPMPPPRPAACRWRVADGFDFTQRGRFTVIGRGRAITALRLTPGPGAGGACGRSELRVIRREKIATVVRNGLATAIVGRGSPRSPDGVATTKVTVSRAGRRVRGTMQLIFAAWRWVNGELGIRGCRRRSRRGGGERLASDGTRQFHREDNPHAGTGRAARADPGGRQRRAQAHRARHQRRSAIAGARARPARRADPPGVLLRHARPDARPGRRRRPRTPRAGQGRRLGRQAAPGRPGRAAGRSCASRTPSASRSTRCPAASCARGR